jgi:hypothetical protein
MSTAIATLERTRASINELIEAAAAEVEADRLEREQQTAQAIEYANSAANISAAYLQGREDERRRVLALLEAQREALGRGGVNAVSLATLSRSILEAE